MKTKLTKQLAILSMASLLTLGTLTGCGTSTTPENTSGQTTEVAPETNPQQTSPMGERPIISYEGDRYVFLNNGEAFTLTDEQIGKEITSLYEGTFYELAGYNSGFRMVFKYNDAFYICEKVGHADDTPMDIAAFFETAQLQDHVLYGDIFDHPGMNILRGLTKEDTDLLLNTFATAEVAPLTTEDHEAIAKAQSEGLSYRIDFTLDDYTFFTSYIIPSMNYITVGDYTCTLEDLEGQIGDFFKDLAVREQIIFN